MFFRCIILLLLAGCSKYYITIEKQTVNANYLASTHVGSPDPRQENPPKGQRLDISWHVPQDILKQKPQLHLFLIFFDYTEKVLCYPVNHRFGHASYKLLDEKFEEKKGILTYRAEIITADGRVVLDWKHQLWVNLIQLKEE